MRDDQNTSRAQNYLGEAAVCLNSVYLSEISELSEMGELMELKKEIEQLAQKLNKFINE